MDLWESVLDSGACMDKPCTKPDLPHNLESVNCDISQQLEFILGIDRFFETQKEIGCITGKDATISSVLRKKGNDIYMKNKHNQDIHMDAFTLYNQSITFAPKDSEELALGYSNRSALLLHLKKFEQCRLDIDRSFKLTKSEDLKMKLLERKTKCLCLQDDGKRYILEEKTESLNILSFEIPYFSTSTAFGFDNVSQNSLVAIQDIEVGEIIFIEKGYAALPRRNHMYLVCTHCLKFCWVGIPCDSCPFVIFCSEECRKTACQNYHDIECSILKYLYCERYCHIDKTYELAAIRFFIVSVQHYGLENILKIANVVDKERDEVGSKITNSDKLNYNFFQNVYKSHFFDKSNNLDIFEPMAVNLLFRHSDILRRDNNNHPENNNDYLVVIKNILVNLTNILRARAFEYEATISQCNSPQSCTRPCDSHRAIIYFPYSSQINHSCVNNVSKFFMPEHKIILFATSPIKKGEQLFINYGAPITMEKDERQRYLKEIYNYECKCEACCEDWPIVLKSDLALKTHFNEVLMQTFANERIELIETSKLDVSENGPFNQEALNAMIEIIKITFNHLKKCIAFTHLLPYKDHMKRILLKFYGEECLMPNDC